MIYLDHAAATPLSDKALKAMQPYWQDDFFNPSAAYLPAVELRRKYEQAKNDIAHVIGAKGVDLVITAGATESINLAFSAAGDGEVLISGVEHPAVVENAKRAKSHRLIKVDPTGRLDIDDFGKKLSKKTTFVSVCLASSELGTIQPISDIARLIAIERLRRAAAGETTPLYLHCDASQGLGLVEVKVGRLGVDLMTINSAKVYGPKGVGALFVGRRVNLDPQTVGGGQENGLRSGTENVPGVIGFAAALTDAVKHLNSERTRLRTLRALLTKDLADLPNIKFLGSKKAGLPNILAIALPGLDAERLIFALEDKGVYLSTGAACAASKGVKSPTLQAIGLNDEEIAGSLRISLGRLNDEKQIMQASRLIHEVVEAEITRLAKS